MPAPEQLGISSRFPAAPVLSKTEELKSIESRYDSRLVRVKKFSNNGINTRVAHLRSDKGFQKEN